MINNYDIFKEMSLPGKLMAFATKDPTALLTRAILNLATLRGARAIGLQDEIGAVQVGKKADLISLNLEVIGCFP